MTFTSQLRTHESPLILTTPVPFLSSPFNSEWTKGQLCCKFTGPFDQALNRAFPDLNQPDWFVFLSTQCPDPAYWALNCNLLSPEFGQVLHFDYRYDRQELWSWDQFMDNLN